MLSFHITLLSLLIAGCASVRQSTKTEKTYKMEMLMTVNGLEGNGLMVVDSKQSYDIELESKGKFDLFTLTSCGREETQEEAWSGSIFANKKKAKLKYYPTEQIERKPGCILHFGAYEKIKGRHTWGLVDFRNMENPIESVIVCNGQTVNSIGGVSVCQSREDLIQKIFFGKKMVVAPDEGCKIGQQSGFYWEFPIRKGICVYRFQELEGDKEHRLTTYGYDSIIIQEID